MLAPSQTAYPGNTLFALALHSPRTNRLLGSPAKDLIHCFRLPLTSHLPQLPGDKPAFARALTAGLTRQISPIYEEKQHPKSWLGAKLHSTCAMLTASSSPWAHSEQPARIPKRP